MDFLPARISVSIYFSGDAPGIDLFAFFLAGKATVYYLPWTSNWGTGTGEMPTAVWQPRMLTTDDMFGVINDEFGFNISWANDLIVEVEASDDLSDPDAWETLATVPRVDGLGYFSDPDGADHPGRFYRLRMQESASP
jgi:hypothetical protein